MENSERYETLSPTETALLRKKSRSYTATLILMAALFIGLAAWGVWRASLATIITILLGGLLVI